MYNKDEFLNNIMQYIRRDCIVLDNKKVFDTDWNGRFFAESICVVYPETLGQIQQIVQLCARYDVGIVPQGGNTSKSGASIPTKIEKPQLILRLDKLNKIIDIDVNNNSLLVESGCILQNVIDYSAKFSRLFPLAIGSSGSCQIGGTIATNAGGMNVLKYGMVRNLVFGLEAVLPNGEIVNQINSLYKRNLGFDINQLFIGSEGTLGIITKASLKLYPIINEVTTILLTFEDFTIVSYLFYEFSKYFDVLAFEIFNKQVQLLCQDSAFFPIKPSTIKSWGVLIEIKKDYNDVVNDILHILNKFAIDLEDVIVATNKKDRNLMWNYRESFSLSQKKYGISIKHDISLPINSIDSFIKINQIKLKNNFPDCKLVVFGHYGDGNLHYNVLFESMDSNLYDKYSKVVNDIVYEDVVKFNGSISAEHGVGQIKKDWFKLCYDKNSYELSKKIKHMIDPLNIFNPGKIF